MDGLSLLRVVELEHALHFSEAGQRLRQVLARGFVAAVADPPAAARLTDCPPSDTSTPLQSAVATGTFCSPLSYIRFVWKVDKEDLRGRGVYFVDEEGHEGSDGIYE